MTITTQIQNPKYRKVSLRGLGLFISFINGLWILLSTLYIIVIDDESVDVQVSKEVNDDESEGATSIAVVTFVVNKIGPIAGRFRYTIIVTHIGLGFLYIICCVIFTRSNEMFILDVVTYCVILIVGAISYQYYESKRRDVWGIKESLWKK